MANAVWQGRIDTEDGEAGCRWHQHISAQSLAQADAVLLGFCCDTGVQHNKGRAGAAQGPDAIRSALASLAWHASCRLADGGNIEGAESLEHVQGRFAEAVATQLKAGRFVIGLGGGHEIAWASYSGLASAFDGPIGIINFDAHFDLRIPTPLPSSGTPFWQIAKWCEAQLRPFHYTCIGIAEPSNTAALFARAAQTGTHYLLDKHCSDERIKAAISAQLAQVRTLYVTVCLDVFPAGFAPGVSAPAARGILPERVIDNLAWIAQEAQRLGVHWALLDVAEMNPVYDQDHRTARLAARLVYEALQAKYGEATACKSPHLSSQRLPAQAD